MQETLQFDTDSPGLAELRGLQELARQLLPLATIDEAARDGLLCIAGITGAGGGAVLWRSDERQPFELQSHFGLGTGRLRRRYRIPSEVLAAASGAGPMTLDSARRRPPSRRLVEALEPLSGRLADGWILCMQGDRAPRGLVLLGRSLVTGTPPEPARWLGELIEVLRLALLGRDPLPARSTRSAPAGRSHGVATTALPGVATRRGVARRLAALRRAHPGTTELWGQSSAVLALLEQLVQLAPTNYTVLLQGETGTGKELAARLLHRLGPRGAGPFETVDCSAIPRELIESELFGHVKGAFTGATRDFQGAFERASGGTLLLDEIGDMDLRSQTRLLRVLQEGSVRRVGGDRPVPVDVRVVAASNRDLAALVRGDRFREDLYYRIHVCLVELPPLRARADDRLVLYDAFMREHARELGRPGRSLSAGARRRLRAEPFPGNVRQVQNVVRQLLVHGARRGPVSLEELEAVLRRSAVAQRRPGVQEQPAGSTAGEIPGRGRGPRPAPSAPPEPAPAAMAGTGLESGDAVTDVGEWVVEQLRAHRFNLRAAAHHLQGLRRMGTPRGSVPVFDRGALDYYLCGEVLRRLVQHEFRFDETVEEIAGNRRFVGRVRRRARAFLAPLAAPRPEEGQSEDLPRAWVRVPETYRPDLLAVVAAVRAGRWQPVGARGVQ